MRKINLRKSMRCMEVGDKLTVSIDELAYCTITNTASVLGAMMRRSYSVHFDRANRVCEITRNA